MGADPLARELHQRGVKLALPVVIGKGAALIFRHFDPDAIVVDGAYGAKIPSEDAPEVRPDIVVAPLLAFTRAGARLGYGGGYYDRSIAALRADAGLLITVGYAFAAQEVDALPTSPLDQRLDWIVTDREAIQCR